MTLSRQRQWQLRQQAKGLCKYCNYKIFRNGRCKRHYQIKLAAGKAKHRKDGANE